MASRLSPLVLCLSTILLTTVQLAAQNDPGPRSGPAGAGSFYPTLNSNEQALFNQALERFQEIDSVTGSLPGEEGKGLGPAFNGNSCAQCHAQPAVGGSSPGLKSPQNPIANPQVALATLDSAVEYSPIVHHDRWTGSRGAIHSDQRGERWGRARSLHRHGPLRRGAAAICRSRTSSLRSTLPT